MFWVDVWEQEVYVGVWAIDSVWEDIQDAETVGEGESSLVWKC